MGPTEVGLGQGRTIIVQTSFGAVSSMPTEVS